MRKGEESCPHCRRVLKYRKESCRTDIELHDIHKSDAVRQQLMEAVASDVTILSNASALLYQTLLKLNWAGFYIASGDELMLGPFQGKTACIRNQLERDVSYRTFLDEAPSWNPDSRYITGKICGVKIEEIEDPTMRRIRCLDKVIDELAKGRPLEKIMNRRP